jgi:hypothetical protein
MLKELNKFFILLLFLLSTTCVSNREVDLTARLSEFKQQEEERAAIGQYAINMMMLDQSSKKKISNAKKLIIAKTVARISSDVFVTRAQKRAFVGAILHESGFQKFAQSPTGPKGYTQLAKKAFKEGAEACGLPEVQEDDVWETEINLYAGACYFRKMIELTKDESGSDDLTAAAIAYNQGFSSEDLKRYKKSGLIDNKEPLKYAVRLGWLDKNVSDKPLNDGVNIATDVVSTQERQ